MSEQMRDEIRSLKNHNAKLARTAFDLAQKCELLATTLARVTAKMIHEEDIIGRPEPSEMLMELREVLAYHGYDDARCERLAALGRMPIPPVKP